jgi:hypothetical protein
VFPLYLILPGIRGNTFSILTIGNHSCNRFLEKCSVKPSFFARKNSFVDTAIKILMAVVIGALVLAGLYALFGDVVLPTLTRRIKEMFNYAG